MFIKIIYGLLIVVDLILIVILRSNIRRTLDINLSGGKLRITGSPRERLKKLVASGAAMYFGIILVISATLLLMAIFLQDSL
jgi:hypothetical protein